MVLDGFIKFSWNAGCDLQLWQIVSDTELRWANIGSKPKKSRQYYQLILWGMGQPKLILEFFCFFANPRISFLNHS